MHLLLDHLGATVAAGGVLLLLALVQLTGQTTTVRAVEFSASRTTTGAFLEVLEQDLANVGAGVPAGAARIHALEAGEEDGALTTAFEFSGVVDPTEGAAVTRVRYEARPAGTVEVTTAGGGLTRVPAYALVRLVERGGANEETARTAGTDTEFEVRLLDDAGAPVLLAFDAARVVAARLSAAPFSGRGAPLAGARFDRRFRLQHLAGT
jgi:hypothetical protein